MLMVGFGFRVLHLQDLEQKRLSSQVSQKCRKLDWIESLYATFMLYLLPQPDMWEFGCERKSNMSYLRSSYAYCSV